jgi:hypothetical protein
VTSTAAFRATVVALASGVLVLASLGGGARAFVADRSVYITSPWPLATVTPPFTIAWRGPHRRYAVFVDIPPIAPGRSFRDLAPTSCQQVRMCEPSADFLTTIGVYETSTDEVSLTTLPSLTGVGSKERHPIHLATVVVVDAGGRRVGAGAWQVEFRG